VGRITDGPSATPTGGFRPFLVSKTLPNEPDYRITVITGFSMGASAIALFARVGGGIYTKAALREMVLPGVLAVAVPVAIGLIDKGMLGGCLPASR
jgi:Na+/H+-translocating membrane pyrophosphatase